MRIESKFPRTRSRFVATLNRFFFVTVALIATIVPTSFAGSLSSAAAVEGEVVCMQCYYGLFAEWSEPDQAYMMIQGHVLYGSCSGGSGEASSEDREQDGRVVRAVAFEDEESRCARCGGTSTCHINAQPGSCHIACGSGGGDQQLAVLDTAQSLLEKRDVVELRSLLDRENALEYNSHRGVLQVLGCSKEVVIQLEVPVAVQQLLNAAF